MSATEHPHLFREVAHELMNLPPQMSRLHGDTQQCYGNGDADALLFGLPVLLVGYPQPHSSSVLYVASPPSPLLLLRVRRMACIISSPGSTLMPGGLPLTALTIKYYFATDAQLLSFRTGQSAGGWFLNTSFNTSRLPGS